MRHVMKKILIRITSALKDVVFPARCLVCESFFHLKHRNWNSYLTEIDSRDDRSLIYQKNFTFYELMTPFLCPTCLTGFLPVESPVCLKCGIMFKSRVGEDHVCGECLESPNRFAIARAPGIYDQAFKTTIHCLKYKGKIQLARPLGILLFAAFISFWNKKNIDLVLSVPLHIKRFRKRGFNQAFLLIKDWTCIAGALNIELPYMQIDRDVLVRSRQTEPQVGKGRKERMVNIKNAFSLNDPSKVVKKRILLVDDVYTSGATVNECAKVLLRGGASCVDVLTLARAI